MIFLDGEGIHPFFDCVDATERGNFLVVTDRPGIVEKVREHAEDRWGGDTREYLGGLEPVKIGKERIELPSKCIDLVVARGDTSGSRSRTYRAALIWGDFGWNVTKIVNLYTAISTMTAKRYDPNQLHLEGTDG